ncbi:MAG: aminopeptidase P family protein [Calditrichaeota bacterium]|nr:MAG: aminopeptidase P family protein [Calditrichota bacterium]
MPDRLEQLRALMQKSDIGAFVITSLPHLRYLFNFSGSSGIAILTNEKSVLVTDNRYREQAKTEVKNAEIRIATRGLFIPVRDIGLIKPEMKIAFEAAHLTFERFSQLHKTFPQNTLIDTENAIERIVMSKQPIELERTRKACEISCRVFPEILPLIKPGVRECEIAAELSYRIRLAGADKDAFEPIVASGWRSALPHGIASDKKLDYGELIVIDFGCNWQGFNSDITRTVALGEPSIELRAMYDAVKEANIRARNSAKPGMPAVELDTVARQYLASIGYTAEFSHSLGHGLGIDVHSLPRIGPKSKDKIVAGSIITIEPGLYKSGIGGVRIEDDLYIGEEHNELLTPLDRELLILE